MTLKTEGGSLGSGGCHDLSVINHYSGDESNCTCSLEVADFRVSIGREIKNGQAKGHGVCVHVCVGLHRLPQRQPEILHLASIIRPALFISRSTNIGFTVNKVSPSLTLKPRSSMEVL